MVSGHRVLQRVGGRRSRAASDRENKFYRSRAEPRWGFSTIKQSAEEALCVPPIAKPKAKINTRKSFFFLVIDRKGKCRSRGGCEVPRSLRSEPGKYGLQHVAEACTAPP